MNPDLINRPSTQSFNTYGMAIIFLAGLCKLWPSKIPTETKRFNIYIL